MIGAVTFAAGLTAAAITIPLGLRVLRENGNPIDPASALTSLRVIAGTAALTAVAAILALAVGTLLRRSEYWDVERRRWPQYEHVAVIIAEEITARFFNVISLFNGFIPIIAIQLSAIEMGDAVTLVFTTVLDRITLGVEEDEEKDEPADRTYWLAKASAETLAVTDGLLRIIQEVDPGVALKYNKHYIGLAHGGVASNYVVIRPRRKQPVLAEFKIARSDELDQRIEDAAIEMLAYRSRYGQYRIQVAQEDLDLRTDLLRDMVRMAHDSYHG